MALLNQTQQQYYDGDDFGGYQFVSLQDIINNFIISYVGDQKIIGKIKRTDVAFHAQRALAELSFDTFKSVKAQEITLPPSLTMVLPQDYVNYTKVCWVDGSGIERPLYPTRHTSNPTPIYQNSDGDYSFTAVATIATNTASVTIIESNSQIQQGMFISGQGVPANTIVDRVFNSNVNQTTVRMVNAQTGVAVLGTYNGNVTVTFGNRNRDLVLETETSLIVRDLTWVVNSNVVTAGSADDISGVKVGMLIASGAQNDTFFDPNTTVVDIQDNVIFLSSESNDGSSTINDDITFISTPAESNTWNSYSTETDVNAVDAYDYDDDIYNFNIGHRYGIEPAHAQSNGSFYIDNLKGKIHFSSNISGKNVILKYISDSLGTEDEMQVHKFAEEAMYKWILCAVMSCRMNVPEYAIQRYKKDKFAAVRLAKLRLSNLKIDELARIMRGKSKWIKH